MSRFLPKGSTVAKVAFAAVGVSGAGIASAAYFDEGTRRSLQFWSESFPIYAHYRFYQLLNRDLKLMGDEYADKVYEELHERYTNKARDITYKMRGFYFKQAQLMSIQDDFVPEAYLRWMKCTQDNVPSEFRGEEAMEYVRAKLKEELNLDFDDVFASWDHKPIGVASIGQVHKATLKTGEVVAVKILLPGMEKKFRADIKTIKNFCRLAMPQHVTAFDEIEKQFCTEFNYQAEAENLNLIRNAVLPKWSSVVDIPRPHMDLCSKHVLVMEYLDGVKLVDGIRNSFQEVAALTGKSASELEKEFKEKIASGNYVFKTIEESRKERQQMERMLLLRDIFLSDNGLRMLYNYSPLRLVYGPAQYHWSKLPLDMGNMLEVLCHVHANQLFEHGAFNGDPHPGNILLLSNGKLGLIDYGQVKKMTEQQRLNYAQLILAHARKDKSEVVKLHFDVLGTRTKHRNEEIGYLMSAFYNDRDSADVCHGMNIPSFLDYLEAQDPMVWLPEDYLFAARMNLMLRGMGKAFGLQLRMSELWAKEAQSCVCRFQSENLAQKVIASSAHDDKQ